MIQPVITVTDTELLLAELFAFCYFAASLGIAMCDFYRFHLYTDKWAFRIIFENSKKGSLDPSIFLSLFIRYW